MLHLKTKPTNFSGSSFWFDPKQNALPDADMEEKFCEVFNQAAGLWTPLPLSAYRHLRMDEGWAKDINPVDGW